MPAFAATAANPVFWDEKLNLFIFELNGIGKGQRLFLTENGYESPKEYWSQSPNRSNVCAYSGTFSEKAGEFSASCSIPLDTLLFDSNPKLSVFSKLQIFATNDAECNLVISMESNGEQYFWQGFNLNKYVKSKGSWWPASCNLVIDRSAIHKGSKLRIYVWNNKKNEIYIDNFKVILSTLSK